MALLRKREKNSVDRRRSLAGVPVFHDNVEIIGGDEGNITLKVQVRRGYGFLERFRPPVTERKYELDEFGTFVVRQVRKRKNVLAIIRAFERRFGMSHRESELGVVAFVKMLMKRNVLSVVVE
ncbi:MAG: PqqD family protein [Planctomycetota bacterium]